MLFESIPRGSIAAQLTAADMLARLQDHPNASIELRQAVTVLGNYMVDPAVNLQSVDLVKYISVVDCLYLG